jgi:hypothetical protein
MTDNIVSTKDVPGEYDALETAKPDEPIFVVQGGDPRGPRTVQFWADFARASARACLQGAKVKVGDTPFELVGGPEDYQPSQADEREAEKLLKKATNAEQVGWAMQAYQRGEEEVSGERAPYNDGLAEALTAEAEDRAAQRKALIAMTSQLHNSLAIANDVAIALGKMQLLPLAEVQIREAVEQLRQAAAEVEPRRGHEQS